MKIVVLEHPRRVSDEHFNDIANTPLWSCLMGGYVVSSLLAEGFDTEYIDAPRQGLDFDDLFGILQGKDLDLLCINAVYFWEETGLLFDFTERFKREGYDFHINLFGFFPTLAFEPILKEKGAVDSVALGECEITIVELARRLEKGGKPCGLGGLAVKEDDKVVFSVRKPALDPDIFPFPYRNVDDAETVNLLASRGCYNQCTFCSIPPFYNQGPLWRGRSVENVMKEITGVVESGSKDLYFVDPNFVGPGPKGRRRTEMLAREIGKMGVSFGMETRPDDLSDSLVMLLRESGLKSLLMGIESGSADVLVALNKGRVLGAASRAIEICRNNGIEPEIGFIMFSPDSTIDDIRHNYNFLLENRLLSRLDRTANLLGHRQIIFMGTSGYERFLCEKRLVKKGIFGFEGHVEFRDIRVKAIAAEMILACNDILRRMNEPGSGIYWKDGSNSRWETENDNLVELFENLLAGS